MQFSDVIGHESLKQRLIQEINGGKISHAQLFQGKPGYGTLPLVLSFVQYLFCENRQESDSCGTCPSCRKVSFHQHPDVHYSFPTVQAISKTSDGNIPLWREQLAASAYFDLNHWIRFSDSKERKPIIGKDESQEIVKKLSLRSFEGGYKVMIIWMAEEMNQACANKLLKIIEEPPEKTVFLLVAESDEYMLQTILSRAQRVTVPRLSMDDISGFLRSQYNLGASQADSVAARSDGDLLEAIELQTNLGDKDENREQFIRLMRVCYRKNVLEMMDWSEGMADHSREYQKVFLRYALHMFRQSMLRNYTEDQLTNVSKEESEFLGKFSRFITGNNIEDFMSDFNGAHYHIERNANPKILFTHLCFQVMRHIHKA